MRPMRLIGPIGLIGFLGCSGDSYEPAAEPPQPTPTDIAIAFNAAQKEQQEVTRAGLETYGTTFFKVYGFKNTGYDDQGTADPADDAYTTYQMVFPGYIVNWQESSASGSATNTSNWEYVGQEPLGQTPQTVKYWDYSALAYRFFAIAGASGTNEVTGAYKTYHAGEADEYQAYEVSYEADASNVASIPYYSHLWFSTGKLPTYSSRQFGYPVQLEFLKPFSQVRFIFTFEDPSKARETTLGNKSFRPTSGTTIKMKGKVTVSYPLTGTATTEQFYATAGAEGLTALTQDYYTSVTKETIAAQEVVIAPYYNADENATNTVYTVLPASDQGSYSMTVAVNGEPKTAIVPAQYMNWQPGYQYTYVFKIYVDGSVTIDSVQSAFTPWTDHTATYTVYNW